MTHDIKLIYNVAHAFGQYVKSIQALIINE